MKSKTHGDNSEVQAFRVRLSSHWSKEEIATLHTFYPSRGNMVATILPGRSADSCYSQAQRLGLHFDSALPKAAMKSDMVLSNCERWLKSSIAEDAVISGQLFDGCGEKLSEQDVVWLVRVAMYLASNNEMREMTFRRAWYLEGCKYFALNAKEMQRHWDILHPASENKRYRSRINNALENPKLCARYKC